MMEVLFGLAREMGYSEEDLIRKRERRRANVVDLKRG